MGSQMIGLFYDILIYIGLILASGGILNVKIISPSHILWVGFPEGYWHTESPCVNNLCKEELDFEEEIAALEKEAYLQDRDTNQYIAEQYIAQ